MGSPLPPPSDKIRPKWTSGRGRALELASPTHSSRRRAAPPPTVPLTRGCVLGLHPHCAPSPPAAAPAPAHPPSPPAAAYGAQGTSPPAAAYVAQGTSPRLLSARRCCSYARRPPPSSPSSPSPAPVVSAGRSSSAPPCRSTTPPPKDGRRQSWSKTIVRKWFNTKTKANDFNSYYGLEEEVGMQWRTSFSERERERERDVCKTKKSRTERLPRKNPVRDPRAGNGIDRVYITNMQDYRLNRRWHGDEAVEGGRGRRRFLRYGRRRASPGPSAHGGFDTSRYSCVQLHTCSLWILFQTASFISLMLISHGYCIMYERLSIRERHTTAGLGCLLYLRLIGYKAAFPYFTLNFVEEDDIHSLHGTLNYTMFKRFHGTMQVAAVAFIMVYMRADEGSECWYAYGCSSASSCTLGGTSGSLKHHSTSWSCP